MTPLDRLFQAARALDRHIILPEGSDARVVAAARRITEMGLARITLMDGPDLPGIAALCPAEAPDLDALADHWHRMRAARGMTAARARDEMRDPIRQAAMRVRLGQADGTVAGAVATTADTVRAALQIIGRATGPVVGPDAGPNAGPNAGQGAGPATAPMTAPAASGQNGAPDLAPNPTPNPIPRIVSSFFLMLPADQDQGPYPTAPARAAMPPGGVIFSDCGLIIEPDAGELAAIALQAAQSCRQLLGQEPRVALLSFSTAGSAEHPSLAPIREALALIRAADPGLEVDGELQFDAAFDDAVRAKKAPASPLSAQPNVFVFPNLAAGNIGYKIAQRLAGLKAIGPILQGLDKPANDLSRACSVDDIIAATAITVVQAGAQT